MPLNTPALSQPGQEITSPGHLPNSIQKIKEDKTRGLSNDGPFVCQDTWLRAEGSSVRNI